MQVRCERDGTVFDAQPRLYPTSEGWPEDMCKEEGFAYPCRQITCPTCGRGYFQDEDMVWRSDRELTILKGETNG
jgi:hypothetical protein